MSATPLPPAKELQFEIPVTNYTLAQQFLRKQVLVRLQNEVVEADFNTAKRFLLENATTNRIVFAYSIEQLKQTWADISQLPQVYRLIMSLTNDLVLYMGRIRLDALVAEWTYATATTFQVDVDGQRSAESLEAFDRAVLDTRTLSIFDHLAGTATKLDVAKYLWFITLHLLSSLDNLKDIVALQNLNTDG